MSNTFPLVSAPGREWWRSAVIYQIYPRSFADGDGDGMGDLKGITERLPALKELGVDAVWFSPFFKSPQKDAGYDVSDYKDIDPLFGTLDDFDKMLEEATKLGLRVIVDLVPNHSSDQHALFQAALKAERGSAERDVYMFRDGKGKDGELPPNNWESVFGGPAWTRITEPNGEPGQWYLHIFDSSQPDFNWRNEKVLEEFESILRFWLDRGVAGFRIDVAHGLIKADGLPDVVVNNSTMTGVDKDAEEPHPFWGQDGVHAINHRFRKVMDEYEDRAMCAEAWLPTIDKMALWVRPGEYHQTFNFGFMSADWNKKDYKDIVDESLAAFNGVGAPSTWVLSNHDTIRHATRMAYKSVPKQGDGIGPDYEQPDEALGQRISRAASSFMLGLPGSSYIYQGEELGLPEDTTMAPEFRQDPTFFRTNGERVGRDGCRVPLPWDAHEPAFGFNNTGKSWLPQPELFKNYARNQQRGVAGSTLELYKRLLKLRREFDMGNGTLTWAPEQAGETSLAYVNNGVLVIANFDGPAISIPKGELLATTQHDLEVEGVLEHDEVAWIKL